MPGGGAAPLRVESFSVRVDSAVIDDLRARIRHARLPEAAPESRFSRDFLLTVVTLYWATGTITSSVRDYYDNRRWQGEPRLGAGELVRVPTAVAVFPHMLIPEGEPPREWAERLYDIRRWSVMPRGGHFAPAEEPNLVARNIAAFFATLDPS